MFYKNGKVVVQQNKGKLLPRSHSSHAIVTGFSLNKEENSTSMAQSKTTDDIKPTASTDDTVWGDDTAWGDDDFDQLLFRATQEAETAEGTQGRHEPSPPQQNRNSNKKFPRMNSDEEIQTENLHLRRQRLAEQETGDGTFANTVLDPTKEDLNKATEKIIVLVAENEAFKAENYKLKGEVSILRRTNDKLKDEQQGDVQARMTTRNEHQKAGEDMKATITRLQQELSMMKADAVKLKFNSPVGNKKVNISASASAVDMEVSTTEPSKPQAQTQPSAKTKAPVSKSDVSLFLSKVPKMVQTDESSLSNMMAPIINLNSSTPIDRPQHADSDDLSWAWGSVSVEIREKIFQKIDQIVELQFQLILPTLERVRKSAPTEIMRRLVRNVEIKSAFPDVVDTMFQWGIDHERKKVRALSGIKEPTPPILPSQFESAGKQYYQIRNGISTSFKYGGTWGALSEVRDCLEKILKSLEGQQRFRLYERNTLHSFWTLLFWASELWRGLLFEEENEELVLKNKKRWVKELEGWTGLILKSDWRDYFAVELEKEVRKLTLGILENIVIAGYFEQKKNRYEILYRILKDVLTHEMFRTIPNVQHVLRIVTWSVSDLMIMKHLCYKTNETNTCLARLIGENVLKLCREATSNDATAVARLFLDYAYLLETLMSDKPRSYHQSKYARQDDDGENDNPSEISINHRNLMQDSEGAEPEDLAASQFACPVKYNVRTAIERMEVDEDEESLQSTVCCWLEPSKYEDPFGRLKLCQCRKVLVGTAIFVLRIVFDAWTKRRIEYEADMENQEILEQQELDRLEYINSTSLSPPNSDESVEASRIKLQGEMDRLNYLRKKKNDIERFLPIAQEFLESRLPYREWNWDDFIRQKELVFDPNDVDPIPFCILELKRTPDVLDWALCKGVVIMNFVQTRSENLAAALGTDAYKTYMMLKAALRLHMDQIDFTRIERDLLTAMTPECEEDHLGSASLSFSEPSTYQPASVNNPSVEYPIPLTPLPDIDAEGSEWAELAAQAEEELEHLLARETSYEEAEQLDKEYREYCEEECVMGSGPYTYRPVQSLERK